MDSNNLSPINSVDDKNSDAISNANDEGPTRAKVAINSPLTSMMGNNISKKEEDLKCTLRQMTPLMRKGT